MTTKIKTILILLLITTPIFAQKLDKKEKKPKCGDKKTCKQMTSCKEAKFYLEECNVQKLDKDKDGIPCESICGK